LVQIVRGAWKRCSANAQESQFFIVLARRKIGGSAMQVKSLVLCVADDWNGLAGRKMLLEEVGCKVLVATSGANGLQLFALHPVDLVLLD
jgi:response regulator RpfG family c-di-GMP phosphodiesterase